MKQANVAWTGEEEQIVGIACGLCAAAVRRQVAKALQTARSQQQVREVLVAASLTRRSEAERILGECSARGIRVLSYLSADYPQLLRCSLDPPFALYVRAQRESELFPEQSVAIVGTRAASVVQCEQVKRFAAQLAHSGVTVISGLALGIDGAAHRGVVYSTQPSHTVAVLAHGLDMVYPPSHTHLAESILGAGGVVVSEYPPGTEARKHHFLERNRIIAGLARGVVVFQAGERSGSLVTARFAADYGRDVFVVLSDAESSDYAGGRKLADDGAQVITSAADVLREYGLKIGDDAQQARRELSAVEFEQRYSLSAAELLTLELNGVVVRLPGGRMLVTGPLPPGCERYT